MADVPPAPGLESKSARRVDPGRRSRIVDACLRVIASDGVAGVTHRKVAAEADVPLGSMTYHFDGMADLLHTAFTRYADRMAAQLDGHFARAHSTEAAAEVVVSLISGSASADAGDTILAHELYTLAARDPSHRLITERWMSRTRATLERHFDPLTARLLDAFMEGMSIHIQLDREPRDADDVREAIRRITSLPASRPRSSE